MDNVEIKKVSLSEIDQLQKIGRQTFEETFSSANSEENMQEYLSHSFSSDKLSTELSDPNSEFYFALHKDNVVGYLKVNVDPSQTEISDNNALELERIYVLKKFHGKKIGQLLYEKALDISREKGVDYIWLGVWEKNPRAIQFYKKNGFVEFDKHVFQLGDDAQTDIMMKLQIKDNNK